MASRTRPRRGVDFFTLLAGIGTILVAAFVLGDGPDWLPGIDLRWVLAGTAAVVGVALLGSSFRGGRNDHD
ncbi:MAG: hypothetical protein GEU86_12595 [Actinophytocola sp.]|nr:hypothetical protein [Actinophytocola sp.]